MTARDGYTISLWQTTADAYHPMPVQDLSEVYDVIIAGGGITGLTTALLLQKAGKRCLVAEAYQLGFGTTGGTTAHLNTLLDTPYSDIQKNFDNSTAEQVARAAQAAINLVKENIRNYSIDCGFENANAYLFAQNDKQANELNEIVKTCTEIDLPIGYTDHLPLNIPFEKVAIIAGQAKFHPLRYLHALANAFEKEGGAILQNCRIHDVSNKTPLHIETTAGVLLAHHIVYATHTPPGVNLLHLQLIPWRSYAMAVELNNDEFSHDLCYDMEDPYHYYRTQEIDGKNYLIAGGKDHRTGSDENTLRFFLELEATVRKLFDVKEVVAKWSSQYYESVDGLPYIGLLPGYSERVFVATGFGGNGMTYSHVSAIILKSLICEEESSIDPELFNSKRIKPVAGFESFVEQNTTVLKNITRKLLPAEKMQTLTELAHGEGKIVKYQNEKIGLYKDDAGKLFAVHPVCTHLKCDVKWNMAERSWDCSCHGARYNIHGAVITGPADKDLDSIALAEMKKIKV